jgi:hypothetical protein
MQEHLSQKQNSENPFTEKSAQSQAPIIRLKFWEIDPVFRCPLIGMCLTFSEQQQLIKKAMISSKGKTPFEIHEILVSCAKNENRLSKKVDRLLERKFGTKAFALYQLEEHEFMKYWNTCFEAGKYNAIFWAAAVRPNLSQDSIREIFGRVHMSMHSNAEESAHLNHRLELLKSKFEIQNEKLKKLSTARRDFQKENKALKNEHLRLKACLLSYEKEKERFLNELKNFKEKSKVTEIEKENENLKKSLVEKTEQIDNAQKSLNNYEKLFAAMAREFEIQKQVNVKIKNETRDTLQMMFKINQCDNHCPAFDLCKKRILIVGGIARMEVLYRQLIESSGGVFEYHEGHMKGGSKQLENSLKRADLVLCPVNCNSHAACSMVKNLCKKHNKPVHMLSNFSLNIVSQVISQANV